MLLVDTNVLLDVATNDPLWADWSQRQLDAQSLHRRLVIDPVVYAELSVGFARIEELERMLETVAIRLEPMPRAALFLAGKAFRQYRSRGGVKTGVLPDFFVGAHAATAGLPLLTRDVGRYRGYFPTVTLIAPEE